MSKMSRRIVVDASVANSAGNGTHPTSRMCREFLMEMLTISHSIVMTQEITIEWKNHASSFSVTWLAAMRAKRRVAIVHPDENSTNMSISDIEGFTVKQIAAMEKDLLLIKAALETDNLIASCDSTARKLFVQAARELAMIRGIVWVNPNKEADLCCDWLKSGARYAEERTLGASVDP